MPGFPDKFTPFMDKPPGGVLSSRHVHPSALYPGGVGIVPSVQLFTE
jgi:hypothetical protein